VIPNYVMNNTPLYDSTCVPHVDIIELSEDLISTRGNNFKLIQHHCHYDLKKFNLCNHME